MLSVLSRVNNILGSYPFSFMFQAPVSMKSVLQAGWLLTVAFGNLIVVIIAEAKFFDSQVLFYVVSV